MKRTLAFVMLLASSLVWGQSETQSTLGTCRLEYARWYPSESLSGEPEVMLAQDIYQQNTHLFEKELHNRADELGTCSITAEENPVGANRQFERLSVAYLLAAQRRAVHRGSDIGMTHQLLLNRNRCSDSIPFPLLCHAP